MGHLKLTGEPAPAGLALFFDNEPQKTAQEVAETNIAIREYKKQYMDYWNSSADRTGTGRPVDGVVAPVAPFAAARRGKFTYYGNTVFANTLDYPSAVIPVTKADKEIDRAETEIVPLSDFDKEVHELYDAELYHGTPVGVQILGRRYQDEKMMTLAGYIADELAKRAS